MSPRLLLLVLGVVLVCLGQSTFAAQVSVAQDGHGDFNGTDEQPILAAIARVRAAGGGEIVIHPGLYVLQSGLELKELRNVTFRGLPGATLKLRPLQHAEVSADVVAGETSLPVRMQQGLTLGDAPADHGPGRTGADLRQDEAHLCHEIVAGGGGPPRPGGAAGVSGACQDSDHERGCA
ncbi:MAG: hypothetical protein ABJF10_16380 [Chthoniobacter sp.]|uniref:hypothetical protein n=1 Tax=Chthoniobacter sp. TaxID=2510640 RepID=UPI0032A50639